VKRYRFAEEQAKSPPAIFAYLVCAFLFFACLCTNAYGYEDQQDPHRADPYLSAEILRGVDLLYNSAFDEAESLFQSLLVARQGHTGLRFYLAMVSWARLASGFWGQSNVDIFRQRIDLAIESGRESVDADPDDPVAHFFLGGALGFKGRFELMRERWFSSFLLASEAVEHLKTCLRLDPGNKEALLGLGIYEYYTSKMSGILRFLSYLLIRRGDKEAGLEKLHTAAAKAVYSASEAKSTLIHIYMFMERSYERAVPIVSELVERYPETARYYYLKGVCHAAMGQEDALKDVFSAIEAKSLSAKDEVKALSWQRTGLYLRATKAMMEGRLDEAEKYLTSITVIADPKNDPAMVAWPLLKRAMIQDLRGEREEASSLYRRVMEMENGSGAQFLAKRYLKEALKKNDPFITY
jgi:tetratricopeptide (TPR) repeat protein